MIMSSKVHFQLDCHHLVATKTLTKNEPDLGFAHLWGIFVDY